MDLPSWFRDSSWWQVAIGIAVPAIGGLGAVYIRRKTAKQRVQELTEARFNALAEVGKLKHDDDKPGVLAANWRGVGNNIGIRLRELQTHLEDLKKFEAVQGVGARMSLRDAKGALNAAIQLLEDEAKKGSTISAKGMLRVSKGLQAEEVNGKFTWGVLRANPSTWNSKRQQQARRDELMARLKRVLTRSESDGA